jgi:hypothetical protein
MHTSTISPATRRARGTIRSRLLVNAVVDPDEAAARLPRGLRPHVTSFGTVVGCCLLEIDRLRPARLPAAAGVRVRAAAHRISVEWDDETGASVTGVYVPDRRSDSRLAVALGGRWFPGVHRRARVDVSDTSARLSWPIDDDGRFGVSVAVLIPHDQPAVRPRDPIGGTCVGATLGVSRDHSGALEAVRMDPAHRNAREVVVESLDSAFISSFATAEAAPAYLIRTSTSPGPGVSSSDHRWPERLRRAGGTGSLGRRVADDFARVGYKCDPRARVPTSTTARRSGTAAPGRWATTLQGRRRQPRRRTGRPRPTGPNLELLKRSRVRPTRPPHSNRHRSCGCK